jgi:hypothetical protein
MNPAWDATAHAQQAAPAIVSGYKDRFRLTTGANQWRRVGRVDLPAGSYAISAKLYVEVPLDGHKTTVQCQLLAGADFDQTLVDHDALYAFDSLALNVVHTFPSPGSAILNCRHLFTAGDTYLGFVKIIAVRGSSLLNKPLLP